MFVKMLMQQPRKQATSMIRKQTTNKYNVHQPFPEQVLQELKYTDAATRAWVRDAVCLALALHLMFLNHSALLGKVKVCLLKYLAWMSQNKRRSCLLKQDADLQEHTLSQWSPLNQQLGTTQ